MKDKAKEQFRAKIYQLIETLKNNLPLLKIETNEPSEYDDPTYEEYGYPNISPDGVEHQEWQWNYRLDPNDQDTAAFVRALCELEAALYTKEGARFLPRGIYRTLIEFADKCLSCKKWVDWKYMKVNVPVHKGKPSAEQLISWSLSRLEREKYQETIKQMIREVYFYENERDESEESFFGSTE